MLYKFIVITIILLIIIPSVSASNLPNITLSAPNDGNISTTQNITFECNVTDDESIYNISLFHNINGTFEFHSTRNIMTVESDDNTTLLCRFDNNYTCEDGEVGTGTSTDFVTTKFMNGVRINNSDTLTYPASGNIITDSGTIEFWVQPGYNTTGYGDYIYLFVTDPYSEEEVNYFEIYIYNDDIFFNIVDFEGEDESVSKSIDWKVGEWHHVVAEWDVDNQLGNGEIVDIFIDGLNSSTTFGGTGYSTKGSELGTNIYIGSYIDGQYQGISVFDEFRILNKPLTENEINASYHKSLSDHTSETATWTINNIPDGSYKWACLAYDNESQGNWSETNFTLYVDSSTCPALEEFIFSPPNDDAIDPSMVVNVTANVSDFTNVSSVVFQWNENGSWTNDTMDYDNITELFENASMTIDQTGGVYYYRIWSNDTWGNSGYSSTLNMSVDWDYTWSLSPSTFGTVYGFVSCSDCYVGTLIINNTADDSMSFTILNDWPFGLSYNVSNPVSIGANQEIHINVTADFAAESSEYDVVLNVTAVHGTQTPLPTSSNVTFSMNSYTGGSYFDNDDISVTNYETSVYQGMSYNLTMELKNIGNDTANNVSINWTLPTGWSNSSGNLTNYIGPLNGSTDGGNTITLNLTVHISSSSAVAGVTNITVSASSSDGLSANTTVTTYVNCNNDDSVCGLGCSYVTDDDCPIPQSPGGGGVSTSIALPASSKEYDMTLTLPERIDVNRGETKIVQIGVRNDVSGTTLDSVKLSLTGYPQTFMKIVQSKINGIGYGEIEYFDVEIIAPVYAVHEKYTLTAKVSGAFIELNKETPTEKTGEVPLVTHKTIANDTLDYYDGAKEALVEMENSEFESKQLKETLIEIEEAIDEGNYDKVKELSESVISKKNLAFELSKKISEMENIIQSIKYQNGELPEAEKMLFLAKTAFQRGEYDRANERMDSAALVYTLESTNAWFTIFVTKYWWAIIIAMVALVKLAFMSKNKLNVMGKIGRLDTLSGEEEKIKGLIMELQKDFVKKKISIKKYNEMISNYESGGAEIRKERGSILSSLRGMVGHEHALSLLTSEAGKIKGMISYLQQKYFISGVMGKEYYDRMMEGLKSELFDIEDSIEEIHTKKRKTGKSSNRFGGLVPLILVFIFLTITVSAVEMSDAQSAITRAEFVIKEMESLGFGVTYANDTLNEAKNLFENEYYEAAESLARKVIGIKEKSINVNNIINDAEVRIYELSVEGYDVTEAEKMFDLGISEFLIDNYIGAEEYMTEVLDKIDEIEAEESFKRLQQTDNSSIVMDYLWLIILVVFPIVIFSYKLMEKHKIKMFGKEKSILEKEIDKLKDAISAGQMKYFKNGTMSKLDYEILVKKHTKRIANIKRRLSFLEGILSK